MAAGVDGMLDVSNPETDLYVLRDGFRRRSRADAFGFAAALPVDARRQTMPVYEFSCRACGHEFELNQTHVGYDISQIRCPTCNSAEVARRWSSIFAKTSKKS